MLFQQISINITGDDQQTFKDWDAVGVQKPASKLSFPANPVNLAKVKNAGPGEFAFT